MVKPATLKASFAIQSRSIAAILLLTAILLPASSVASDSNEELAAAPMIVDVTPAARSIAAALDARIEVHFSEAMNASTVSYEIAPAVTVNASWPSSNLLWLEPVSPGLTNCTIYGVRIVTGEDLDEGLPLVPGAVPNPWSFMTVCDHPFILDTNPGDKARNVRPDTNIVVTFSEPMNCLSLQLILNPTPLPPSTVLFECGTNRTVLTVRLTGGTLYESGLTYSATAVGLDDDGNGLVPSPTPNPWSFDINAPPQITSFTVPVSACIDAGLDLSITWTMTDDLDPAAGLTVRMSYRNASGQEEMILGPARGFGSPASFVWRLPDVDVATRVQLIVNDSAGGTAIASSAIFRIDRGPPSVVFTRPTDAERDVSYLTTITIQFSEPMDLVSVEQNLSVSPILPDAQFTWILENTTVVIFSNMVKDRTSYTVTVGPQAADTCIPGRLMGSAHSFTFVTGKAPSPPPASLWQTDVGETSVTISWEPVTKFVTGGDIPSGLSIRYHILMRDVATAIERDIATTGDVLFTVRDLKPSSWYRFRIVAEVDNVSSVPSAALMVRTLDPFLSTATGQFCLLAVITAIVTVILMLIIRRERAWRHAKTEAALIAEIQEIVNLIRKVRAESSAETEETIEKELNTRFRDLVKGGRKAKGGSRPHARLEELYRALARELVSGPEIDLAKGQVLVDTRLGSAADKLRLHGSAYRILSEAEASIESQLFRRLPDSGRKALLLVYFYALEDYMSHRLRQLVPPGATILMGERGHLNVRKKDWPARWAAFTLGTLVYIADHNRHFFVEDKDRWEDEVGPLLKDAIEARNRTAHVSLKSPPLKQVRDLVYGAIPAVDEVLKKPRNPAK